MKIQEAGVLELLPDKGSMKNAIIEKSKIWRAGTLALVLVAGLAAGCKQQPAARTDQQIATDVQAKIQGEQALANQNIQVSVKDGVATLSGTTTDEASRALAGNDSGAVPGIKTVVNNLAVQPAPQVAVVPVPQPMPAQPAPVERSPRPAREKHQHDADRRPSHQQSLPAPPPPPQQVAQSEPPPPPAPVKTYTPPPPPKPVVKQVTLPAGTVVPVRVTETLTSKTAQPNDVFHASVAGDIGSQGVVVIPRGTPVLGRIVDAREAAHFKGNSLLSLELTQLTTRGQRVDLVTNTFDKAGAGRGKNTIAKTGGGAALGAIIGGLAGGGKGAAIGGLAGGGLGAGANGVTRGEQTEIPTETLLNFELRSPITVTVTIPPQGSSSSSDDSDPSLQRR